MKILGPFYIGVFMTLSSAYALIVLDDNGDEENKLFSNSKSSASACCLALA